jgi:hypothetical protein
MNSSNKWREFSPAYEKWRTTFLEKHGLKRHDPLTAGLLRKETTESLLKLYRDLAPALALEKLLADVPDRGYGSRHAAKWAKEVIEETLKSRNVEITAHD